MTDRRREASGRPFVLILAVLILAVLILAVLILAVLILQRESPMSNRERVVVYGLLVVLLAMNVSALLGGGVGASAIANPRLDDGVESLTLAGTDDDADLVLVNRGGRLAWSDSVHDRAYSTAFVFIGKTLNKLMQSEELSEERDQLVATLRETEADYRERLAALGEELQQVDRESDEGQERLQEGSTLYQEFMAWQQEAMAERGRLDAKQLERAYRDMIEAVEVVSDRQGIDTVLRFIPTEEEFRADSPDQAMLAIRLRSALRYPDRLDITDEVLEELSLPVD